MDATPAADPEYSRLHGLYWLLAEMAERSPTCLLVDDLQWADHSSAQFLGFLASRLEGMQVAVVAASRASELPDLDPLINHPNLRVIRPSPLSEGSTRALVEADLGPISDDVGGAVRDATGGNPFLVTELIRELRERTDRGSEIQADWIELLEPERIARAVMMRIAHAGPAGVPLAEAIAVLGDETSLEAAAALARLGLDEVAASADALADAGILVPGRPLAFEHSIVRQAVYGQIPFGRREVIHAEAAELLHETGASAEVVAAQLLLTNKPQAPWTGATLKIAANSALNRGDPALACTYLHRALVAAGADDEPELLLALGLAEGASGTESAAARLKQAYEKARDPQIKAKAGLHLAFFLEMGNRRPEALRISKEALLVASASAPELVPRLQGAVLLMAQGTVETRREIVHELNGAFKLAERVPNPPPSLLAVVAIERCIGHGQFAEGADLAARALSAGLIEEVTADAPPVYFAAGALALAGRFSEAARWCETAIGEASTRGSATGAGLASAFRSWVRIQHGDLLGAASDAQVALSGMNPGFVAEPVAVATLGKALIHRGNVEGALGAIAGLDRSQHDESHVLFQLARAVNAEALLAVRRPSAALAELELVSDWEVAWGAAPEAWCPWRSLAALAHNQLGNLDAAHEFAEEAVTHVESLGSAAHRGRALRIAALVGSAEAREGRLREAVAILAKSGAQLERAFALADLGAEVRRTGRARESREPLEAALAAAQACGATALVDRTVAELSAAGASPRAPSRDGLGSLTPSEHRAAELAAGGMSNPEIAQALFVTRKTVETHLGAVYRKLEISSRAQLAPRFRESPSSGDRGLDRHERPEDA